ncbi:hypothetical protein Misp02_54580 [Microtetraspora sp. NBRC 16547]|nr:hypothetical protein Misp02_54580 [Microtetraspora sp. NBRC 16547]
MIFPEVPGFRAFGVLVLLVLAEDGQQLGRALEGQPAPALALPKDDAAAGALRAAVGVAGASLAACPRRADVAASRMLRSESIKAAPAAPLAALAPGSALEGPPGAAATGGKAPDRPFSPPGARIR